MLFLTHLVMLIQQRRDEWFEKKKGALYDHFTEQEQQLTEQSIFDYAPNSNGAADYRAFIKEIIPTKGGSGNNGSSEKEL